MPTLLLLVNLIVESTQVEGLAQTHDELSRLASQVNSADSSGRDNSLESMRVSESSRLWQPSYHSLIKTSRFLSSSLRCWWLDHEVSNDIGSMRGLGL